MPTNQDTIEAYDKLLRSLRREIDRRGFENLRQDLLDHVIYYDGPVRTATDAWWEEVLGKEYLTFRQHENMRLVYEYVTAFSIFQDLKQEYQALAEEQERDALLRWQAKEYVKQVPTVIGVVSGAYTLVEALVPEAPPSPRTSSPLLGFTNRIGMEFVRIPAGTFRMGSPESDRNARPNEKPVHRVQITRAFYLGKYPVTQSQWQAVMGNNPSHFKGDLNRPVEHVSWNDVQEFFQKLNVLEASRHYRLPTEAEWEYACRAGSTTIYCFGNDERRLGEYAWYEGNSGGQTHPIGQKRPNAWGLYDMHGNVWEWCQDWHDNSYYRNSPAVDPSGPDAGAYRVIRGGSWGYVAQLARSADRYGAPPGLRVGYLGFRCLSSGGEPRSGA